jgi:hypothetical protein
VHPSVLLLLSLQKYGRKSCPSSLSEQQQTGSLSEQQTGKLSEQQTGNLLEQEQIVVTLRSPFTFTNNNQVKVSV